ncbi:hypothetical protein BpHYR1_051649 [Brachionus plicatilis]|uniref:Uncharacterized protein n=1 Tax=Brachionus plicatilis TaxID=10195 RepID=A0A3M7QXX9_BRAPC|nr:hypothetical protein BpHYR1_051649 [Brachionus plicatilis]
MITLPSLPSISFPHVSMLDKLEYFLHFIILHDILINIFDDERPKRKKTPNIAKIIINYFTTFYWRSKDSLHASNDQKQNFFLNNCAVKLKNKKQDFFISIVEFFTDVYKIENISGRNKKKNKKNRCKKKNSKMYLRLYDLLLSLL